MMLRLLTGFRGGIMLKSSLSHSPNGIGSNTERAENGLWVKYPVEWAGVYLLEPNIYELVLPPTSLRVIHILMLQFFGREQAALEHAVTVFLGDAYALKR